jgi:hypothetical protein
MAKKKFNPNTVYVLQLHNSELLRIVCLKNNFSYFYSVGDREICKSVITAKGMLDIVNRGGWEIVQEWK